ncbi:MAG: elongation factor G [Planctomycetota bacterium]|nr:elongation factor G [Planctomycetota bacterium]
MPSADIRNVTLVGHYGTGKTTLAEALLFKAGAIKRKGSVKDKNTVSDFDADEKERGASIETSILHCDHGGKRINLLDTPGTPDFVAGVVESLAAAETALIAVNAAAGVEVMTRKLWGQIDSRGLARVFVLTKMDHERANFEETLGKLKEIFGPAVTPLFMPLGQGAAFKGAFSLMSDPAGAPPELAEQVKDQAASLKESIISADEKLMERYLMDEKIEPAEISACFAKALLSGSVVPVLCCAAEKDLGVGEILDFIAQYTPEPTALKRKLVKGSGDKVQEQELTGAEDAPFYAQVFKSKRDPFIGKISYLRCMQGTLAGGSSAKSSSASRPDRFAHFLSVQGKDTKELHQVSSGEIFAVAKNENLVTGDTLSVEDNDFALPPLEFPVPMSALAVTAKNRKDEGKISEQLRHLAEGDPTFKVDVDPETKELVIHGIGQPHLDLMLHRLKHSGVEVETRLPKIPYRSTVTATAEVRYRHKKQSGGSGQFGEVQIKIEPNVGAGYEFIDEIVGGVIPNNLIPSVDKGIQKKLADGVWPGILVVDVKVRLNDGKSHPVDSKDIAFQIAGRQAFNQAFEKARPVLIEPIVHLEIMIPAKFMGDITGLISGKRGRVQGMDQMGDMLVLKAQAPASEVQSFASELKSITAGEGFYSMEFSHYENVPNNIAQPVIDAAKARKTGEDE